jgi:hypothetical protein
MSALRRTVWGAFFACSAVLGQVQAQAPCNCAPPYPYAYGYYGHGLMPAPYGTVGPGFSGHWIYGQLSPYPSSYYGPANAYGVDRRYPRVPGPDAPGRSQVSPALPYRSFEEYLKSQSPIAPPSTSAPVTPPAVPAPNPMPPAAVVPPPAAKSATAMIEVHVPEEKAVVTLNDFETKQGAMIQVFQTQPLKGKQMFKVRARWGNEITGPIETQFIEVGPGETKVVTFPEKKN